jgi:hypothetical protein
MWSFNQNQGANNQDANQDAGWNVDQNTNRDQGKQLYLLSQTIC